MMTSTFLRMESRPETSAGTGSGVSGVCPRGIGDLAVQLLCEPPGESQKRARKFVLLTKLLISLAGGLGFEPRQAESEEACLAFP